MAWKTNHHNTTTASASTRIFAISAGILMMGMIFPSASAFMVIDAPGDSSEIFPSVSASQYEIVEAATSCAGEYAVHTNTEIVEKGWWLLLAFKTTKTVKHTTSIDYTFECSARFTSTISGSGGVDRQVGFRAPATQSGGVAPVGSLTTGDVLIYEEELDGGCDYLLGGCTTYFSIDINGGETKADQRERPTRLCDSDLPEIEAFNRPNLAGQRLGPLGIAMDALEETTRVSPQTTEICVNIDWAKVEDISLSLDLDFV